MCREHWVRHSPGVYCASGRRVISSDRSWGAPVVWSVSVGNSQEVVRHSRLGIYVGHKAIAGLA